MQPTVARPLQSAWGCSSDAPRLSSTKALLPPVAAPDAAVVRSRCSLTKGDWCGRYDAQIPIPVAPPPRGTQQCLWSNHCNFVGVCDGMTGWCRCPAGWTGDDCGTRMKVGVRAATMTVALVSATQTPPASTHAHMGTTPLPRMHVQRPCSQHWRKHGFEPYNAPTDPSKGGLTMACADLCDEDVGAARAEEDDTTVAACCPCLLACLPAQPALSFGMRPNTWPPAVSLQRAAIATAASPTGASRQTHLRRRVRPRSATAACSHTTAGATQAGMGRRASLALSTTTSCTARPAGAWGQPGRRLLREAGTFDGMSVCHDWPVTFCLLSSISVSGWG